MSKLAPLIIVSAAVLVVFVSSSKAGASSTPDASGQSPGSEIAAAESFIAAIRDEKTSIVRAEPKCGDGTTLRGSLVIETPPRAGFPFSATTFADPRGIYTTVTTTGDESEVVIDEVAKTLNIRADNYVKRLLRNCSL
jgi:hypothetical protein